MNPYYIKDTLSPLMFDHEYEHTSVSGERIEVMNIATP